MTASGPNLDLDTTAGPIIPNPLNTRPLHDRPEHGAHNDRVVGVARFQYDPPGSASRLHAGRMDKSSLVSHRQDREWGRLTPSETRPLFRTTRSGRGLSRISHPRFVNFRTTRLAIQDGNGPRHAMLALKDRLVAFPITLRAKEMLRFGRACIFLQRVNKGMTRSSRCKIS